MNKKLTVVLSLFLALSLIAGCSSGGVNSKAESGNTIKVGLNFGLSGAAATYGQGSVEGIELAFEEINKNGGVLGKQIELAKYDNKSEDTESANVSTKLATRDKVVAILGSDTSGSTKAAIPAAMQNKIPIISPSATSDDVTVDSHGKVKDYVFKTCFNDSFQGIMMAEFAYTDLGYKKAAILADTTSDYAQGLSKAFNETFTGLGGVVISEEAYQAKDTDFKAVLTNIKGKNPEVLFVPGYYEEVGLIIRQARELGINIPILGGDGYESPKLLEIAGKDSLNNVYYSSHYSPMDDSENVVKFKEAFKAKYDKDPDAFNALGYDLAYFLADALERTGEVNPEKLREALASTKNFTGVTGSISIDGSHNPVKSVTIIEVKEGQPTFLKKLDPQ
ncbi:Leucine-, isoleucine-, valine-, threonine-, and alanine-binding protein Leu/Ile/Val/Thr/Ala-binding protein [Proteiniborus sp. DW1]|uniref:ABC transporter substrate-binding protein n=1 Tax=Proteiniborus sp. DW1 TaxID=1889883 RepID=UPI00092E0D38|nr:ABC transporter substrate-binding protein [Proteiniborus sp. DW1]SCG84278.1 Leucine-, isoleucine-, valine-, threonine-, and alanine-binding protein Leu/Ile/Val/Thr/Ala-binding protein [Proteiniborus sp. DW1]